MADLLNDTPTSILILGNQRHCKNSRAEAIMSVIGAKTWFQNYVEQFGTSPPDDQLVLGKYPLAFVNEMRRMFGSSFFDSQGVSPSPHSLMKHDIVSNETEIRIVGSLLPFGDFSKLATIRRSYGWGSWDTYWKDHSSVKGWEILYDGSVLIKSAGVVASTTFTDIPALDLAAQIIVTDASGKRIRLQTDLQKWLKSFPPQTSAHAICLAHCDLSVIAGIILMGIAPTAEPHGLYVKWGEYSETPRINHPEPDSREGAWRII